MEKIVLKKKWNYKRTKKIIQKKIELKKYLKNCIEKNRIKNV